MTGLWVSLSCVAGQVVGVSCSRSGEPGGGLERESSPSPHTFAPSENSDLPASELRCVNAAKCPVRPAPSQNASCEVVQAVPPPHALLLLCIILLI